MKDYERKINLCFELKGTPESSRESYFRRIQAFIAFIQKQNKSLDDITATDIQQYILYLKQEKKLSAGTINNYISGVRWFYTIILEKEWNARKIPRMKRTPAFPVVPPKEDVLTLVNATTNLKHKAFLVLLYGSGLRVSEVAKLKICDICSKSMRIRVEKAKHNTNRYTILSKGASGCDIKEDEALSAGSIRGENKGPALYAAKANFWQCIPYAQEPHHNVVKNSIYTLRPIVGKGKVCPNSAKSINTTMKSA